MDTSKQMDLKPVDRRMLAKPSSAAAGLFSLDYNTRMGSFFMVLSIGGVQKKIWLLMDKVGGDGWWQEMKEKEGVVRKA